MWPFTSIARLPYHPLVTRRRFLRWQLLETANFNTSLTMHLFIISTLNKSLTLFDYYCRLVRVTMRCFLWMTYNVCSSSQPRFYHTDYCKDASYNSCSRKQWNRETAEIILEEKRLRGRFQLSAVT